MTEDVLGSTEGLRNKITHIRVEDNNTLVFCFPDGREIVKRWQYPSRADSWTDEMRAEARKRTLERYEKQSQTGAGA